MADNQTTLTAAQEEMVAKARTGPADQPIPVQDDPQPAAPTRAPNIEEWGPYNDYKIVPTQYGEFGLPKGEILYFVEQTNFSHRENRMVTRHVPQRRQPHEPRIDGNDPDLGWVDPN